MAHGRDEDKPSNTVSNILDRRDKQSEQEEIIKERQEEYKKAINSVAATPNGKLVFDILIKASGVYEPVNTADARSLLRANDRNFYLKFIRPYLEPQLRKELEN